MRLLSLIFLFLTTLTARENPFFAKSGEKDISYTSNTKIVYKPLQKASIELPNQARLLQEVTIKFKNLDGSIETKSIALNNSIDWHLPIFISQNYNNENKEKIEKTVTKKTFKKIAHTKYADFFALNKQLKIKTTDTLLRNFLLVNPHRIVLDFKRISHMKSYTKINPHSIFSKIKIGNHSNYYRVVITLDGYYKYNIKKENNILLLNLQ